MRGQKPEVLGLSPETAAWEREKETPSLKEKSHKKSTKK